MAYTLGIVFQQLSQTDNYSSSYHRRRSHMFFLEHSVYIVVIATEFLLNIQINAGVNVYLKISMVSALHVI